MKKEKYKEFVVYKITNTINSMSYIGITGDYKRRMRDHFGCYDDCYLHRAIRKYGKKEFKHEIIFGCSSWEDACKEEIEYVKAFNTKRPNGYNLTDGGEGLSNPSEEIRKKISKSHIGMNHTVKSKEKMSKIKQNISIKTRRKMSESSRVFTDNQILEIRKLLVDGIYQKDIAKQFGVQQMTISNIKTGKHYFDVQSDKIDLNKLPLRPGKLCGKQILEVKKMLSNSITQNIIAKKFSVDRGIISKIKNNKYYEDIQLPEQGTK